SRETIVIFFSFISTRSPCRDDPTDVASKGTNKGDFYVLQKSEYQIACLALAVGSNCGGWSFEDNLRILESDVTIPEDLIAFLWIPIKVSRMCEQTCKIFFRHSEWSPT